MAEREGFEPPVSCDITSFQDWRLKPLGHLSMLTAFLKRLTSIAVFFGLVNCFFAVILKDGKERGDVGNVLF